MGGGAYLLKQVAPHAFHVGKQPLPAAAAFARQFQRSCSDPCRKELVEPRIKGGIASGVGNAEKCCSRVLHVLRLQFNPSGIVSKLLDDDARGLFFVSDAGMHLFENNIALADAADFQFADVVPDYVLEAFAIATMAMPCLRGS